MRRLLPAALVLATLAAGCFSDAPPEGLVCRDDSECPEGYVCFPNGCGDPGQNIVVEVTPNPKNGLHAQDIPVESLRPQHNFELTGRVTVEGKVHREGTLTPVAYSGPLSLRLIGESALIPGLPRRYESTLTTTSIGEYNLPVGTGNYTLTLQPTEPDVPPVVKNLTTLPGAAVKLDVLLPASTSLTRLTGKLVRHNGLLVDADLEVQLLDSSLRPLSQSAKVQRSTGDFSLALASSVLQQPQVLLMVTADQTALVPQKVIFPLDLRQALQVSLEMGDYGEPVPVRGRVLGRDGAPVAGALVYLQGVVGGGGLFRSGKVTTGADGRFEVSSLPSAQEGSLTLFAVPPPSARAGLTWQAMSIPRAPITLPDVVCPNKLVVQGSLLQPDGSQPAAGVVVKAEPLEEVPGWPRPPAGSDVERWTDASGHFQLSLDPGVYRVDFMPSEHLPRVSRIVTVLPEDPSSPDAPVMLAPFTLSKGRRVSGLVSMREPEMPAVPYASVRFFRVTHVDGKPSALLLAQTLTDSSGVYFATLPTR